MNTSFKKNCFGCFLLPFFWLRQCLSELPPRLHAWSDFHPGF